MQKKDKYFNLEKMRHCKSTLDENKKLRSQHYSVPQQYESYLKTKSKDIKYKYNCKCKYKHKFDFNKIKTGEIGLIDNCESDPPH